jgi:hypothetical protein
LLRPALEDVLSRFGEPVLVDAGSGNAYLGFVLYELFLKPAGKGTLLCIESRPELTAQAAERAQRLAEVARQLKERAPPSATLATLAEHPWHRREFGSHLTNVLRALALEVVGYTVTVTELTGWEHSLKNELLLGKKVRREDARARERLERLLAETGVAPKVTRALGYVRPPHG